MSGMIVEEIKPFHESIIDSINKYKDGQFSQFILIGLWALAFSTEIRENHDNILKAFREADRGTNSHLLKSLAEKFELEKTRFKK